MKKTYIIPSFRVMECEEEEELMKASGVFSEKGIDYGGIDEDGEMEAESRRSRSPWFDED